MGNLGNKKTNREKEIKIMDGKLETCVFQIVCVTEQ